jgi:putative tryptophan/tyrosine transport system substrate-binding protein
MQRNPCDPVDAYRRRIVLCGAIVLLGVCPRLSAQSHAGLPRIGFLSLQSSPQRLQSFASGMREFGYVDGKTVAITWRLTQGKVALLSEYAAELVKMKPELIIAVEPQSVEAVRRLTSSIPIVFVVGQDPVGLGFARSLARPGGNITGSTSMSTDVCAKQIELIRSAMPDLRRVAVMLNPTNKDGSLLLRNAYQAAAQKFGMSMAFLAASSEAQIAQELLAARKAQAEVVIVAPDGFFVQISARIAALATEQRLPSIFLQREAVTVGGLLSYGPDARDQFRRTGYYVHRILKGAKPADLPIEQPTRFVTAVNLKTARVLGIAIAPSVLAHADEVVN